MKDLKFEKLIEDSYGLSVKSWIDDWGGMVENSKKAENGDPFFSMMAFEDDHGNRYNLVHHEGDFPNQEHLVQSMRDYILFDVRDYRLIAPRKATKNYFLYQLIPFTIKGEPTWKV